MHRCYGAAAATRTNVRMHRAPYACFVAGRIIWRFFFHASAPPPSHPRPESVLNPRTALTEERLCAFFLVLLLHSTLPAVHLFSAVFFFFSLYRLFCSKQTAPREKKQKVSNHPTLVRSALLFWFLSSRWQGASGGNKDASCTRA